MQMLKNCFKALSHCTSSRIRFTVSPFWKRADEDSINYVAVWKTLHAHTHFISQYARPQNETLNFKPWKSDWNGAEQNSGWVSLSCVLLSQKQYLSIWGGCTAAVMTVCAACVKTSRQRQEQDFCQSAAHPLLVSRLRLPVTPHHQPTNPPTHTPTNSSLSSSPSKLSHLCTLTHPLTTFSLHLTHWANSCYILGKLIIHYVAHCDSNTGLLLMKEMRALPKR